MNGITSTLQDEIKKKLINKNKEKFKIVTLLISTNLFVFIMTLTLFGQSEKKVTLQTPSKVRADYQWLVVPAQSIMVELDKQGGHKGPISIFSSEKKLLAEKAYIHELYKAEQGISHFKFEIHSKDIKNFTDLGLSGVLVVPHVQSKTQKIVISNKKKRGSIYEVDY